MSRRPVAALREHRRAGATCGTVRGVPEVVMTGVVGRIHELGTEQRQAQIVDVLVEAFDDLMRADRGRK